VERALAGSGLTFTQWLVLEALDELIAERDEAAMQFEVAVRVGLDQDTISLVVRTLADRALVDRGPDFTGKAWRAGTVDPSFARALARARRQRRGSFPAICGNEARAALVGFGIARVFDVDERGDGFDLALGLDLALAQDFELGFELSELAFDLTQAFFELVALGL
jgi:hypothetical protein